jgi:hypothetical protein
MVQTNWNSLGTPVAQQVYPASVGRNADGRLEVFVTAASHSGAGVTPSLWHIWQTAPGGTFSAWATLDRPPNTSSLSNAAVGRNADGRLEVFTVGSDGALWHLWQTTPGGSWSSWFSSGQPSVVSLQQDLAVVSNADGRLEVFAAGSDGAIWHLWQTAPNGTWSDWASLGKPSTMGLSSPVAGLNADGRIEVFTVPFGDIWHIWQTSPGGDWSSSWTQLSDQLIPSKFDGLALGQNADGRLEIFARATDGALWHLWQTAPNGNWSPSASLGSPSAVEFTTPPTIGRNLDGRLESLIIGNDGALWHLWQTAPNGNWSTWASLGSPPNGFTPFSLPIVSENADGRLEAFALEGDVLWHTWQVAPGGDWGG